jgi:flagellar biosynthesis/type III secretory pathway M-ring protein FliF/YscJ
VLSWIGLALTYVMLALAYVLFWLLRPLIEWLMQRAGEQARQEQEQDGGPVSPLDELSQGDLVEVPPALVESAQWIGLVVVLVVIGVAIALALRYFRAQTEEDVEETRETIFSTDLLQAQLAALWRRWTARGGMGTDGERSPYLSLADELAARREVRAIYQELLGLARVHGHGREAVQTPLEYLGRLAAAYPGAGEALETLTQHYVAVRYSEEMVPRDVVEGVREAWARLQEVVAESDGGVT